MKHCSSRSAVLGLSALIALAGVTVPATQVLSQTGVSRQQQNFVYASDDSTRLNVPVRWQVQRDLNPEANLQVADLRSEEYLIVITESKAQFPQWTFRDHSDATLDLLLNNLGVEASISPPSKLTIGGRQAVQYEIRTEIQGLPIVYLHTTVDGQNNYHQLLAWTLESRFSFNQSVLQGAIASFEEVSP